ncbi:MAG: SPFH/Band 7/PHB domain protein [Candidatus Omnitrophica bacterium]|nr:SPFH/Band 7/PHB domain protein [Candidatus Omnitrophota bacterium]
MDIAALILTGAAIFVVLFVITGIRIVPQAETMVIERLGKYHKTLQSGINFILPIIDKVREIDWKFVKMDLNGRPIIVRQRIGKIDLREIVYDYPKQNVITRDNVVIEINAILYFQITNPMKSVYEVANLPDAIEKLTQTTLRNVVGEMDLDHTLSSRETINSKLRAILDEATDKWGVKVSRVELQDINPPEDIRQAMEKQMRAERDKRAAVLTAEGSKQAKILEAEGFRQSEINQAEGRARAVVLGAEAEASAKVKVAGAESEAIHLIAEAVKKAGGDPTKYLIAIKYIETLKQMAAGNGSKTVYIPYEATGVLSSLGGIKELFAGQAIK